MPTDSLIHRTRPRLLRSSARFSLLAWLVLILASPAPALAEWQWRRLESIPDPVGFAGPFAGVSDGALLLAGGANFPGRKPWEGGTKVWHDSVFVLENPAGHWRRAGRLPAPLAYGVAVSHRRGLVCIGGSDDRRHHDMAMILRWTQGRLEFDSLPRLPIACANAAGALVGDTVFVAGGNLSPDATNAMNTLFALDLSAERPQWRTLAPLPGTGRMLSVAGAHEGAFYWVGGAALKPGSDGKPAREWLREAWQFREGQGWRRLADLPHPVVAAPSPAPVVEGRLLVLGGDDGAQSGVAPGEHRGFRRDVLAYDSKADRWERQGELPFALVTTPAVTWAGGILIPGGEARPGVRSTEVWEGRRN